MRIAFVVDSVLPLPAGGLVAGARLINRLRSSHDVVTVAVGGDVALKPLQLPLASRIARQSQFVFAWPNRTRLREVLEWCDVVHVQLPFFLGYAAMRLAHTIGKPVVAAHHVQPENMFATIAARWPRLTRLLPTQRLSAWLDRLLVRTFYNRANAVICPSQLSLRALTSAGLTVPSHVISNGAPSRFMPLPRRPFTPFTVLSVGRLVPEKRHDLIIEALRRAQCAPHVRLVIAGRGPCGEHLQRLAQGHPAHVRVGYVDDDELVALYQTANLYVHASDVELEGLAVLEAMRCGCPAIIANSPSSASTQFALDDAHLFAPDDPDALARALDHWFFDRAGLGASRVRSYDHVRHFGIGETIAAYERVYRSLSLVNPAHLEAKRLAA